MCGIIGCCIKNNSIDVIRNLFDIFLAQKHRGTDGAGLSVNDGKELYRFRSVSPYRMFSVYNIAVWRKLKDGCSVMVHHRYPTSSPNEPKFNHPIADEKETFHLIHNGIISNHRELYGKLTANNHTFETEEVVDSKYFYTDSEVLVHQLEECMNGDLKSALKCLYKKAEGSFAVAMSFKGTDGIYLLKHSNPIIITKDKHGNYYFSSEYSKNNRNLLFVCELKPGEIGRLTTAGYEPLVVCKDESFQSSIHNYRHPSYEKQYGFKETVQLGDDIEEYVRHVATDLMITKPKIKKGDLYYEVFEEVAQYFPDINLEEKIVRIAIRQITDEVFKQRW